MCVGEECKGRGRNLEHWHCATKKLNLHNRCTVTDMNCMCIGLTTAVFNDYAHLTGCTRNKHPVTICDDTPILHLLSYSVGGEQGNDLLYCVIADVVSL